mmetsp:Transcript_53208/g.142317  ORF Transcript_53208/g.142317 Transcript_53208/m.142317 type:complete len:255 (+) Transcript_53208:2143-2907(+)
MLSSKLARAGLKVPIIEVFELPLSAFDNSRVSLEFLNFDMPLSPCAERVRLESPDEECLASTETSGVRGDGGRLLLDVFRFADESPRLWMQLASHMSDLLMNVSSPKRWPDTFVVFSFSRPARSTKMTSEATMVLSVPPRFSILSLNTVCARELLAFMAVAATVFMVLAYSMRDKQFEKVSTTSSVEFLTYTPSTGCTCTSGTCEGLPRGSSKSRSFSLYTSSACILKCISDPVSCSSRALSKTSARSRSNIPR